MLKRHVNFKSKPIKSILWPGVIVVKIIGITQVDPVIKTQVYISYNSTE